MICCGGIKYKNKTDKEIKYHKLRKELKEQKGYNCAIWTEDKTLMYQYDDIRQSI